MRGIHLTRGFPSQRACIAGNISIWWAYCSPRIQETSHITNRAKYGIISISLGHLRIISPTNPRSSTVRVIYGVSFANSKSEQLEVLTLSLSYCFIINHLRWYLRVQKCGSFVWATKSGCWARFLNSVVEPNLGISTKSTAGRQRSVTWAPEELLLCRVGPRDEVVFDRCSQHGDWRYWEEIRSIPVKVTSL